MELTVKEIRTLQLALLNMEDGLNESGIAKMKALSEKLEQEATRLTKRALDTPIVSPSTSTVTIIKDGANISYTNPACQ